MLHDAQRAAWGVESMLAPHFGPELLKPDQRRRLSPGDHPTTGCCYMGAEAAYHLLGGKAAGWTPVVATFQEGGERQSHWWLRHATGVICDPTAAQFGPELPPYHLGKGSGFLTRQPSRRASALMHAVRYG